MLNAKQKEVIAEYLQQDITWMEEDPLEGSVILATIQNLLLLPSKNFILPSEVSTKGKLIFEKWKQLLKHSYPQNEAPDARDLAEQDEDKTDFASDGAALSKPKNILGLTKYNDQNAFITKDDVLEYMKDFVEILSRKLKRLNKNEEIIKKGTDGLRMRKNLPLTSSVSQVNNQAVATGTE